MPNDLPTGTIPTTLFVEDADLSSATGAAFKVDARGKVGRIVLKKDAKGKLTMSLSDK
jgi:hypothetical protein